MSRHSPRLLLPAVLLATALLSAGCQATPPSSASLLESTVAEAAAAAAGGDYEAALATLDELRTLAAAQAASGAIDAERYAEIDAAIDRVRSDLDMLLAADVAGTPSPTEPALEGDPNDAGSNDGGSTDDTTTDESDAGQDPVDSDTSGGNQDSGGSPGNSDFGQSNGNKNGNGRSNGNGRP